MNWQTESFLYLSLICRCLLIMINFGILKRGKINDVVIHSVCWPMG